MKRELFIRILFVLIILATLGEKPFSLEEMGLTIPVIDGGENEDRYYSGQRRGYQISFTKDAEYLSTATVDFYQNYFSNKSWTTICHEKSLWRGSYRGTYQTEGYPTETFLRVMLDKDKRYIVHIFASYRKEHCQGIIKGCQKQDITILLRPYSRVLEKTILSPNGYCI